MGQPSSDTIFALASGAGRAAVAVLRLSGAGCGPLLAGLAGALPAPRRASLRPLRDPGGALLDRALVLWFPGPASFTGEDAAELHLHGGRAVIAAVSDALVAAGARPAEPGEFTRRAFAHGRLDLTAAEGIAELVEAETEAQRRQAMSQAEGALGRRASAWSARLTVLLARAEAAIDFAEEDLPDTLDEAARRDSGALAAEIALALDDGGAGERLRDGLSVAILGAPNVGKSSLLNALLGREAAIVSATAGTTRDVVEGRLVLGGVPATLADTAGLRDEAAGEIEAEGIRRAHRRGEASDIVLAVFAADSAPDAATLALLARPGAVAVASRCDLARPAASYGGRAPLAVSARTGEGLDALRARLAAEAGRLAGGAGLLTRPRHRAALAEAARCLEDAAAAAAPELLAEALRGARLALGRLTGAVGVESVLDAVFREFCIGK